MVQTFSMFFVVLLLSLVGWPSDCRACFGLIVQEESGQEAAGESLDEEPPSPLMRLPVFSSSEVVQRFAVDNELDRMKSSLDLDSKLLERVKEELKDEIVAAANRLEAKSETYESYGFCNRIEYELHQQVWQKVRGFLPPDKLDTLDVYQDECNQLSRIYDANARRGFIVFLDEYLSLTKEQVEGFETLLAKNWNREWNEHVSLMHFNSSEMGKAIFDSIPKEAAKEFLSNRQVFVLANLGDFETSDLCQKFMNGDIKDWHFETCRRICQELGELEVERLDRLFGGLTPKQNSMLGVAIKGVASKTWNRWKSAGERYQENIGDEEYSRTLSNLLEYSVKHEFAQQKTWNSVIAKIFTADQVQQLKADNNRRHRMGYDHLVTNYSSVIGVMARTNMTLEQHQDLEQLFRSAVGEEDFRSYEEDFHKMGLVADEDYQNVLTERQWRRIRKYIADRRTSMEKETLDD